MPSNSGRVSLTCVCSPGSITGITASLSSDNASLAAMQSARRRTIPERTTGSLPSSCDERVADGRPDVRHHRLVEVDAAEALDALRLAHRDETVADPPQHGGVERAAAEVVHRDDAALVDPLTRREVDGGRLWFRHEPGAGHAGDGGRLLEQLPLVRTPVRGVGDRDRGRWSALAFGHGVDHVPDHRGHETL